MFNEEYAKLVPLWECAADCYYGADRVKNGANALEYLPIGAIEREELRKGTPMRESRYAFRRRVATYENFFRPIVDDLVGLMQRNPASVRFGAVSDDESAKEVRDLKDWGTRFNDGLVGLKARLNFAQILYGRYGMLLDVVADRDGLEPIFQIAEYPAQKILDGQVDASPNAHFGSLRWAMLDESTKKFDRTTKERTQLTRRRLLALDASGRYYNALFEGDDAEEQWRAFDLDRPDPNRAVYPLFKGAALDFIPFTVCNVERLGLDAWERPPYIDVARVAIENYVVDSWYKLGLYLHATPTLAVCNAARESNDVRLGGVLWPRSSGGLPVSVSILETNGAGLAELRAAKNELKETLRYASIRDLLERAGANSSSDSLRVRATSGTVSVAAIDKTGARAIEEQLCFASRWSGATVEETRARIAYEADVSYLGTEFQLDSIVDLLKTNEASRYLSDRAAYSLLNKAASSVLPSFDDNELQKEESER